MSDVERLRDLLRETAPRAMPNERDFADGSVHTPSSHPAEPAADAASGDGGGLPVPGGGAMLLDALAGFVQRFVVVNEAQATAVALFIGHTYAIDAANATPYLHLGSAEPESGKTRLLEVLHEVVRAPLSTMNISDAALFRAIEAKKPTLLFDEVDAIFGAKARDKDDLRSLLNAGYRRGSRVYRMGGGNNTTLESFEVFGPKALAGLGSLPPTLASRAVRIALKRRRPDEPVEDFFPDELVEKTDGLRAWLESWASMTVETLKLARPERIAGLRDRTNEVWRPLLAIAELADGSWPVRARRAALALCGDDDDEVSLGILLLGDIRTVFDSRTVERIATADLLTALGAFEESPWGEWWLDSQPTKGAPRRLAQLLRPYGVRSQTVRLDEERTAKGYRREDFVDAWERFLPARVQASQASQASQLNAQAMRDVTDVTDVTDGRESTNGVLVPGADGYLDRIAAVHEAGHITTDEALECELLNELVLRRRA